MVERKSMTRGRGGRRMRRRRSGSRAHARRYPTLSGRIAASRGGGAASPVLRPATPDGPRPQAVQPIGIGLGAGRYRDSFQIATLQCPQCGHELLPEPPTVAPEPVEPPVIETHADHPTPPTRRVTLYRGKDRHVVGIGSIGPVHEQRLLDLGIQTTDDLVAADPDVVAFHTGAPRGTVVRWMSVAELTKVPGIGPRSAELLVLAGVASIDDLKGERPQNLMRRIQALEAAQTRPPLGGRRIARWIASAKRLRKHDVPRRAPAVPVPAA